MYTIIAGVLHFVKGFLKNYQKTGRYLEMKYLPVWL